MGMRVNAFGGHRQIKSNDIARRPFAANRQIAVFQIGPSINGLAVDLRRRTFGPTGDAQFQGKLDWFFQQHLDTDLT